MGAGKKFKQLRNVYPKRKEAFFTKIAEYSKLSLDEMKELFNHPDKKIRPGGIYREALIEAARRKQLEVVDKVIETEAAGFIGGHQQVTEEPVQVSQVEEQQTNNEPNT